MPVECKAKICLDIDGVLADFVGGAAKLIGYDPAVVTMWDYYPLIGKTESEFWAAIDAAGDDFWASLDPYHWIEDLHSMCKQYGDTILLTANSKHHSSAAGKVLWMQKHFGGNFRDYLMGPKKEFCATPNTILIDDSDANCGKFRSHGGYAILFPQPWNENRGIADKISYVSDTLKLLTKAIRT